MINLEEYLDTLGLDQSTWLTKYEILLKIAKALCNGEEILDIFITDVIDNAGNRSCQNLWFFSKHKTVEAKNFQNEYEMDVVNSNTVMRAEVQLNNFDLENFGTDSIMSVSIGFQEQTYGQLQAARENCVNLWNIVSKYYVVNI